MGQLRSVFIVEDDSQGWIINRLVRDIANELNVRGITSRIGTRADYGDQDVIFNSRFMTPFYSEGAVVNSLFITHIDDRIKELELRTTFARFDSFVCLSPHDAEFVAALKGSNEGVVGIELPAREQHVRPIRLAYFSARYEDGRKNEQWILEYFRDKPAEHRAAFVFCFLGWGWETFCAELADLEMNFEIHRYSRFMPGEYQLYKEALDTVDALIYLGFDGGAMSVYDALAAGIRVIAPDASYHRGLDSSISLFSTRKHFFVELDRLWAAHSDRTRHLQQRSIHSYTERLLTHWEQCAARDVHAPETPVPPVTLHEAQVERTLSEFRGQYKPLSFGRIRSALIRWLQLRLSRS